MKQTLSFLFIVFYLSGCVAMTNLTIKDGKLMGILPVVDNQVTYAATASVPGLTKDQIYRRARRWIVENFKSANDVIQLQDVQSGELIAKGYSKIISKNAYGTQVSQDMGLTIILDAQDGRYRLKITQISLELSTDPKYPSRQIPVEIYKFGDKGTILAAFEAVNVQCQLTIDELRANIRSDRNEKW